MPESKEPLVDLPSEGDPVSVEIDEEPVQVESETVAVSQEDDSDEHVDYSKKVQKRIDKLTKKVREAERQQEAAIHFARNVQHENSQLKTRVNSLDEGYVSEYGDRIASQSEAISKDLETAIATNDTTAQVDLNKKLAQLAVEEERVRAAKAEQARLQQAAAQAPPQAAPQMPQAPVRPDPKAEAWASDNDWFGEDEAMTFAAFGIHKKLIEEENFDTNSRAYYAEIDKRIREAFPHKFNGGADIPISEGRRPQQAVASATRSSKAGRKTVRLSPSEVAIATKLGVPLDEYAKHSLRLKEAT